MDEIQLYQDQKMAGIRFRICRTKDLVKRTKTDYISLNQVLSRKATRKPLYLGIVPGMDPDVTLQMTGTGAASQYYVPLPSQDPDLLFPEKETAEKKEGGSTSIFRRILV